MTRANPPPQKLPDDLEDDLRDVRGLFTYLEDVQFQQYQMWKRSGAGDDFFDSIDARLDAVELRLDAVELRLDLVEARVDYLEGDFVVTAVDFTTIGNITVVVTADVTISLTLEPNDKDIVRVKQTDTQFTIDGNGRTIEGNESLRIRKLNTSTKTGLVFIYSEELDEWFIT